MAQIDKQLIEFAKDWSERLPARSDEIEQACRLPADIATAFAEGGIFHSLVPVEYGGGEVHPSTFIEVIKLIATGDGAAGWNVMIGSTTGLLSASLPREYAQEIYGGGPGTLSVGVTAPLGKAVKVDGGYQVTGRWPFGSGSQNADWISGGCFVYEDGEQRRGKGNAPEVHLMMFSKDQVEIEDTWHVSGLKGTGSHHFNVNEQFVPDGRSVVLGGRPGFARALYQFPMLGLLAMGVSAVSLGIGYKAMNSFKSLATAKVPTGATRELAQRAQIQATVAEAKADLDSAEAYIHAMIEQAWREAEQGNRLSQQIKASLRLAAVNATRRSVSAVDKLYQAGGGTAIYENSELQRCFRDVHVTTQHIMVGLPIYEVVGRVELGLEAGSLL